MKRLFFLFGLAFLCGCVREEIKPSIHSGFTLKGDVQKIDSSALSLELVGSRDKICGKAQHLTFRLKNNGTAPLTMPDWRSDAASNFLVECQIWFPGTEKPDDALWLTISEPPEKTATRYPLTLDPDNMVTFDVPLEFVESLRVSPGSERRYFVRARLVLDSAEAVSPVAAFSVRAE